MTNDYVEKKKRISNTPVLYLKELEKEQSKPRFSRRKEIAKIRAKTNEIRNYNNKFHQMYIAGFKFLLFLKRFTVHEEKCMPTKMEKHQITNRAWYYITEIT